VFGNARRVFTHPSGTFIVLSRVSCRVERPDMATELKMRLISFLHPATISPTNSVVNSFLSSTSPPVLALAFGHVVRVEVPVTPHRY
jgi:hypothetical protein